VHTRRHDSRLLELCGVVALVVGAVGLPLISAFASGAIDVPQADDWAYSRMALRLAETGELRLVGWGPSSVVGHVLWAQPFLAWMGPSIRTLHLAQTVAAAVGVVAGYAVARSFLPVRRALLAAALVAAAPGYGVLATSFMTDTTAYAATVLSLLLGLWSLRRRGAASWGLLALSLLVGIAAGTMREVGLVAPAGVLVGHAWRADDGRRQERIGVMAAAMATVGAVVLFQLWRQGLQWDQRLLGGSDAVATTAHMIRAWCTLALVLVPALLVGRSSRRAPALVAGSVTAVAGLVVLVGDLGAGSRHALLAGGALDQRGSLGGSVLLGERPELFADPVWALVMGLALLGAVLLSARAATGAVELARGLGRGEALELAPGRVVLGAVAAGTAGTVAVYAVLGGAIFDRYLWPAVLAGAVLLLSAPTRERPAGRMRMAVAWVLGLGLLSAVVTLDEHAYDAARWRAGEIAVERGNHPRVVDAGFEWVGYHDPGVALRPGRVQISDPHPTYLLFFPGVRNCVIVAASPLAEPNVELVDTLAYSAGPLLGERRLYTYRNPVVCGDVPPG